MDGTAKINSADREALFALVTTPRPIGLTSKRIADIILALCGIVLLFPFFVICFVATAFFSPGPVLFRHRRVGFNGKRFDCLKFRTMAIDAPERLQRHLEADPAAAAVLHRPGQLVPGPMATAGQVGHTLATLVAATFDWDERIVRVDTRRRADRESVPTIAAAGHRAGSWPAGGLRYRPGHAPRYV